MYCKKCGKELKEGTRFCPKCGNEIGAPIHKGDAKTQVQRQNRAQKRPEQPAHDISGPAPKNAFVPVIIVIAVLVFVAACACGFLFFGLKNTQNQKNDEPRSEHMESVEENEKTDDKASGEGVESAENATESAASEGDEKDESLKKLGESDPSAKPADGEQESGMSTEEIYRKVSDLFGGFYLFDGDTYEGFYEYKGSAQDLVHINGDVGEKYEDIISFDDNVLKIKDSSGDGVLEFRYICPWMIESYPYDGEPYWQMDGDISSINAAMVSGGVPEYVWQDSDHVSFDRCRANYQVCRLARNEVYARHGRKFKDKELQEFFNARSWYNGTIEADDFKQDMLNDVEKANVKAMKEWEEFLESEGETN